MSNSITLPPDLAAKVEERVAAGDAHDAVEVIRAGLAALEAEEARKFDELRAKIDRTIADPRPSIPADEVFAEIEARIDAHRRT
ncbi:MAG: type II toxin-antitoxin system ParD family antitoxin [Terricaulis sp.]